MHSIFAVALFILSISAQPALAGEIREIELNDGSVITGEVLSLSNGTYSIKSDSLGTVKIEETKIRAIRSRTTARSANSLTDRMMNDQEIMSIIQGLQNDADFQKILADPEIMKAVESNDLKTLLSRPEFLKLLDKTEVENIREKVK